MEPTPSTAVKDCAQPPPLLNHLSCLHHCLHQTQAQDAGLPGEHHSGDLQELRSERVIIHPCASQTKQANTYCISAPHSCTAFSWQSAFMSLFTLLFLPHFFLSFYPTCLKHLSHAGDETVPNKNLTAESSSCNAQVLSRKGTKARAVRHKGRRLTFSKACTFCGARIFTPILEMRGKATE